jgi:hypothetical protein
MVALIAYMQKLGTYEKVEGKPAAEPKPGLPDRGFGVPDRQRSESAAR